MNATSDKNLFQSVINMVDSLSASGNYDTIIHILSLLCLLSVLNKTSSQQQTLPLPAAAAPASGNPLQKLLGDLLQGGAGNAGSAGAGPLGGALSAALGSPDLLMSLLPLLNNPQIKAKFNPSNIASVMGIINNLGGLSSTATNEKAENTKNKPGNPDPTEKKTAEIEIPTAEPTDPETPAPIAPTPKPTPQELPAEPAPVPIPEVPANKPANRFLKWKTNF